MASIKKFTRGAVNNQIRHVERTIKNPSNRDIDVERFSCDYKLSPQRDISSFAYYTNRISECYCYGRSDLKTLVGIICTMPQSLDSSYEDAFFQASYDFLTERYGGEKNVISAVVHRDESGMPHMHFLFVPVVYDEKKGREKVCANEVLSYTEYQNFHPAYQKYLYDHDIPAEVATGVTRRQGGNITVAEMKQEREIQRVTMADKANEFKRGWI